MKVYLLKFPDQKTWSTYRKRFMTVDSETKKEHTASGFTVIEVGTISDVVPTKDPQKPMVVPHAGYHVNICVDDDEFQMDKDIMLYAVLPNTPRHCYGGCEDVPLDTADKEFTQEQKTYMRVAERKAVIQAAKDSEKSNGFVEATR